MHPSVDQIDRLLNSEGFRAEVGSWMADYNLAFTDIDHVRLTRDASTGRQLIVIELHDGRMRAFPFAMHTTH